MKVRNKILLIVLFALCILMFSFSSVKATVSNSVIVDGYDMSDVYNHVNKDNAFFICAYDGFYRLLYPKSSYSSTYTSYVGISPRNTNCVCYYDINWQALEGNNYDVFLFDTNTLRFSYAYSGAYDGFKLSNGAILYSNQGVYNQDHTTFFMSPPIQEPEIPEVPEEPEIPEEPEMTLAGIMKAAGDKATMEMGQIILIVIAATVGLTVLLLGLKKGLTVLMNGFRH